MTKKTILLLSDDIPCMKRMGINYLSLNDGDLNNLYKTYLEPSIGRDIVRSIVCFGIEFVSAVENP